MKCKYYSTSMKCKYYSTSMKWKLGVGIENSKVITNFYIKLVFTKVFIMCTFCFVKKYEFGVNIYS